MIRVSSCNMASAAAVHDENDIGVTSGLLQKFFKDKIRDTEEWSLKCRVCNVRIKSKPGVTSNFHRHLKVRCHFVFSMHFLRLNI